MNKILKKSFALLELIIGVIKTWSYCICSFYGICHNKFSQICSIAILIFLFTYLVWSFQKSAWYDKWIVFEKTGTELL